MTRDEITIIRLEAERHLDRAQAALTDDRMSDDDVLAELDKALACLNRMIDRRAFDPVGTAGDL